jgi:hypothetical protein
MTSIGAGTSTNARVFDNRLAGTELDRILGPIALLRRTYRHEERPCPACGKLYTGGQWIVPAVGPNLLETCSLHDLRLHLRAGTVHETLALDFRGEGVRGACAAGRASFFGMSRRLCSREART